jgi:septal ring factor EnvC (AmiA/AmiB activator)
MGEMIRNSLAFLIFISTALFLAGASAQTPAVPNTAKEIEKAERAKRLDILRGDLKGSREKETRLKAEIDKIKNDRKKFSQELVETAARIRAIETRLTAIEAQLEPLDLREAEIKKSLDDRRGVLSEVLAALQKIGSDPVPALMIRPEDALESVRSAILLGAIVPQLRAQAEKLVSDLTELAGVRRDIAVQRESFALGRAALDEEKSRISALIEERQRQQSENEKALESERSRAQALANEVVNVQDLVTRMEQEIVTAARAAEIARKEDEARTAAAISGRISPALPFAQAKGKLPIPVSGTKLLAFGAPNQAGGTEKGISLITRPNAQVSSPCEGRVVFAGNFRNYGQLLIINGGGGYHILLAGMERITVDLGQSVTTGEPVAIMGSESRMAAVSALGFSEPILYIEFRKDGNSIDPSPWWATTEDEKVRG